jgi:hypothetical protein
MIISNETFELHYTLLRWLQPSQCDLIESEKKVLTGPSSRIMCIFLYAPDKIS